MEKGPVPPPFSALSHIDHEAPCAPAADGPDAGPSGVPTSRSRVASLVAHLRMCAPAVDARSRTVVHGQVRSLPAFIRLIRTRGQPCVKAGKNSLDATESFAAVSAVFFGAR